MEYDHMAELGLTEDKQLICSDVGFITSDDPLRDLCFKFVRNGDKVYNALQRYDSVISYALSRDDGNCGTYAKWLVPILLASGVNDKAAYETCTSMRKYMPGAESTLGYLSRQLPTFFCTETYEHAMMGIADQLDFPGCNISCNMFSFDNFELSRPDARTIRELIPHIASLAVSEERYTISDSKYLTIPDNDLIDTFDKEFVKTVGRMDIMEQVRSELKVAGNEKAYALLEICRKNEIPVSDTAFIGTRNSDFPAMDIVRDSSGLALAFNGSEYAVRGCNVAVMSDRPIAAAVLVNEFYNGGIESVFEMIDHWTHEGLREWPCADRNLMNEMLAQFPTGLPEVYRVDHRNYKEVAAKSLEFRKKRRMV